MDKNLMAIHEKHAAKTIDNLAKNNILGFYVNSSEQAVEKVAGLMKEGELVAVGGSMTLFETGIIDHLRSGRYNFLDRYKEGLSRDQQEEIFRKSFLADTYITSTNAITEAGELYNVDGTGNRVAAMIYGPRSVIVVAGINKIVKDIDEAVERVRRMAAPANSTRLDTKTPCIKTGHCVDCRTEGRICCSYAVLGYQKQKNRIKVIIVGEELGY